MKRSRPWPKELDDLSAWIGSRSDLVQGPGGNTSFKNENKIWVKASGTRLEEALEKEIFAELSLESGEVTSKTSLAPSIEKFFHLSNPYPYVVHVHSLGAMSVSFRADCDSVLSKIAKLISLADIPYARPGEQLHSAISKVINFEKHDGALLRNHGLLVWGATAESCKEKIILIETLFSDWKILGFDSEAEFQSAVNRDIGHEYLVPDHAVFFDGFLEQDLSLPEKKKWLNIFANVLTEAVRRIPERVSLRYLAKTEVAELRSWESEIARKATN